MSSTLGTCLVVTARDPLTSRGSLCAESLQSPVSGGASRRSLPDVLWVLFEMHKSPVNKAQRLGDACVGYRGALSSRSVSSCFKPCFIALNKVNGLADLHAAQICLENDWARSRSSQEHREPIESSC
jgi:hypothetical protein